MRQEVREHLVRLFGLVLMRFVTDHIRILTVIVQM
jgi:hypothetical protein